LKQHYFKNAKPPSYYNIGNIYLNVLHTRIRNNCSALHNDLFHSNLIHSPILFLLIFHRECWAFFIVLQDVWCTKKYCVPFFISWKCTHWLKHFAFGSQIYNIDTNRHAFITVETYIKETYRFSFRWLSWM